MNSIRSETDILFYKSTLFLLTDMTESRTYRNLNTGRFHMSQPILISLLILLTHLAPGSSVEGSSEGVRVWPQVEEPHGVKAPVVAVVPKFTEIVSNTTVVVGRSATLKCSVENLDKYKIAWVKSDTQTLLSIENTMITRNYRLRVSHSDDTTWFLHIDEASMSDRGYYMCQINTVPPLVKQGFLEVVVPPNIVDDKLSGDVEVSEDASAQLKCMATGYPAPEIKFRRQEGKMLQKGQSRGKDSTRILTRPEEIRKALREEVEDGRKTAKVEDVYKGIALTIGYLTFDRVTRDDMGHYLCIANNSVPPSVSKRMILNIRYREPEVIVGQQMLGVFRGDDVAINCTVTAYPRAVVFWQDGSGRMIISGGRYQIFEKTLKESPPVLQTTLVIKSIEPEDITSYTCNASIDNDEARSKSLMVELNEMARPSTETAKFEVLYNAPRQGKNVKKSRPGKNKPINNDVAERYEKTASYKPEVFLNTDVGPGSFESGDIEASSSSSLNVRGAVYCRDLRFFSIAVSCLFYVINKKLIP